MDILIIAIDHELQKVKRAHEPRERAVRKGQLEALLRREIARSKVGFIGEEASPSAFTIAKQLADAHEPRIPWKNIDMSDDERKEAGIYEALKNRPCYTEVRDGGRLVIIERRIAEDETREEYFVEQTKQSAGGAQSILILCGDLHVEAMKEKLERDDCQHVETDHSLVERYWV